MPKQPTDHLAAVETEAEAAPIVIEFNGAEFTIPGDPLDWTNDAMLAFEQGKAVTALREILGADVYARHKMGGWSMRQTQGLFEIIAEKAGFARSGN